jgi:hypothetical protein
MADQERFPQGLDYQVGLDTTQAVSEGMREISNTLWQALLLVILVVFVFLQGWRPTLIPLLAVPVSLVGTFMLFPAFGFSVNTLSLFGLVLAIGLVVDDAIVVVEAVEHHIEEGMSPATRRSRPWRRCRDPSWRSPSSWPPCSSRPRSSRDHRPALPAVRADDRDLRDHLGVQRPLAQPRDVRDAAPPEGREPGARSALLRLVQPPVSGACRKGYVGFPGT